MRRDGQRVIYVIKQTHIDVYCLYTKIQSFSWDYIYFSLYKASKWKKDKNHSRSISYIWPPGFTCNRNIYIFFLFIQIGIYGSFYINYIRVVVLFHSLLPARGYLGQSLFITIGVRINFKLFGRPQ